MTTDLCNYFYKHDLQLQLLLLTGRLHPKHAARILCENKKHLKNVGPICHCEPPHAHSPDVASGTVARRLRIDVHDVDNDDNDDDNNNDNA